VSNLTQNELFIGGGKTNTRFGVTFSLLTVWPLTSTLLWLVSKQCLMVFGRQTFLVRPSPEHTYLYNYKHC